MKKVVSFFLVSAVVLSFGLYFTPKVQATTKTISKAKVVVVKKVAKKVVKKKVVKKKIVLRKEPILPAPLLTPDPSFYNKKK